MNIALILAGGTGTRMGLSTPKQYWEVAGKPVIAYCLECFRQHREIDKIHIVADPMWQETILRWTGSKFAGFSVPGESRQLSILHGLKDILTYASAADHVIIHDAVRPMVSERIVSECMEALRTHEGVLPVLPMKDTVYECADGRITALLDRKRIMAGQAPEAFVLGGYYEANLALLPDKILSVNGSAEPAVLAGMDMVYIPGEEANFKLTTREDLKHFERLMEAQGEH